MVVVVDVVDAHRLRRVVDDARDNHDLGGGPQDVGTLETEDVSREVGRATGYDRGER
jgi:hypothetical protein